MRTIIYIVSQASRSGSVNQFGFTNKDEAEKMLHYLNSSKRSYFKEGCISHLVASDDMNDFIKIDRDAM